MNTLSEELSWQSAATRFFNAIKVIGIAILKLNRTGKRMSINHSIHVFSAFGLCVALTMSCNKRPPAPAPDQTQQTKNNKQPTFATFDSTLATAESKNQPLLVLFTGSDWCDVCKDLKKTVTSTDNWGAFITDEVSVYTVDIPMNTPLPQDQLKQNKMLQTKWQVKSFPTLLVIDSVTGEELGRTGYIADGTVDSYIKKLRSIISPDTTAGGDQTVQLSKTDIRATTGSGDAINYLPEGYEPGTWTMDLDAAVNVATAAKIPILLNFTDSKNCQWCKVMNDKVLSQASWQRFARKSLALVAIDFRMRPPLPEAMQTRNETLRADFKVQGYPTFVLVEPDGKTLIATIQHELSPRGFRLQVKEAMKLFSGSVESTAALLSPTDAQDYRKTVASLKAARVKKRELDARAMELFKSGGLTREFNTTVKETETRALKLRRTMDQYERTVFAAKLEPKTGERYLRLLTELYQAEDSLLNLSDTPDRSVEQIRAQESMLSLIRYKLEEIEVNYHSLHLPDKAAELYLKLFKELQQKRTEYRDWLASDPQNDELTNTQNKLYLREINELQDRMDAIQDLQSNQGGSK